MCFLFKIIYTLFPLVLQSIFNPASFNIYNFLTFMTWSENAFLVSEKRHENI